MCLIGDHSGPGESVSTCRGELPAEIIPFGSGIGNMGRAGHDPCRSGDSQREVSARLQALVLHVVRRKIRQRDVVGLMVDVEIT